MIRDGVVELNLFVVLTNFNSIISTLDYINETDSIHGSDASSLLKNIQDFEFIFYLKLMKQVLQRKVCLYIFKKKKNANYSSVGILTNTTLLELESLRNDDRYKLFWTKTEQFATKEDIRLPNIPKNVYEYSLWSRNYSIITHVLTCIL